MPAGTSLTDQGQTGREAFVIVDGSATVKRNGQEGRHPRAGRGRRRAVAARPRPAHRHRHHRHRHDRARHRAAPLPRRARRRAGAVAQAPRHASPAGSASSTASTTARRGTAVGRTLAGQERAGSRARPTPRTSVAAAMSTDDRRVRPSPLREAASAPITWSSASACSSPPFTARVGRSPAARPGWEDDSLVTREVFGGIPGAAAGRLLHGHPRAPRLGRVRLRRPGAELGAGRPRPAAHHAEERQAPRSPTSAPASTCAPCCATRRPASCTR